VKEENGGKGKEYSLSTRDIVTIYKAMDWSGSVKKKKWLLLSIRINSKRRWKGRGHRQDKYAVQKVKKKGNNSGTETNLYRLEERKRMIPEKGQGRGEERTLFQKNVKRVGTLREVYSTSGNRPSSKPGDAHYALVQSTRVNQVQQEGSFGMMGSALISPECKRETRSIESITEPWVERGRSPRNDLEKGLATGGTS